MMWDGKKAVAQKIFYDAMDKIRERSGDDPLKAVQEGRRERQAAARSEDAARGRRQLSGADRSAAEPAHVAWRSAGSCINARVAPGKGMPEKLANELNDAANHARRGDQEEGRRPPHGGGQQGFRALPLVTEHSGSAL